jgi:hypothetical protein
VFYRHATTVNNSPTPNGVFGRLMDIIRLHIDTVRLGKGGNKQVKNKLRTSPTSHAYGAFRLTLGLSLVSRIFFHFPHLLHPSLYRHRLLVFLTHSSTYSSSSSSSGSSRVCGIATMESDGRGITVPTGRLQLRPSFLVRP